MADAVGRYELTTSLRVEESQPEMLGEYIARLDAALSGILENTPLVTAYFVLPGSDPFEIEVGLRFEGMKASNIEPAADHIIEEAMEMASEGLASGRAPEREESTLVPA